MKFRSSFIAFCTLVLLSDVAPSQVVDWTRQFGSSSSDETMAISADALGNIFIVGRTLGAITGTNNGGFDSFVVKLNPSGTPVWTRQFGTTANDVGLGASTDGLGNLYISGYTSGGLQGSNFGGEDAFLRKYDTNGGVTWTRQLGTTAKDRSNSVSYDAVGNVYLAGVTNGNLAGTNAGLGDAFLSKYDGNGNFAWSKQFGTTGEDVANSIAADPLGNVFVTGNTSGNLAGMNAGMSDAFLRKYDASGTPQWTRQFGTTDEDRGIAVAADGSGNVYLTGFTQGSLEGSNLGSGDAYLSKYNSDGTREWIKQFGSTTYDLSTCITTDGNGNIYVGGYTFGNVQTPPNPGGGDYFLTKFDAGGNLQWSQQFGTFGFELGNAVSADGLGNVYLGGATEGDLMGMNAGSFDAFAIKVIDNTIPSADFDGSGRVDAADLARWKASYGVNGMGDADHDGDTDGNDFLVWQRQYRPTPVGIGNANAIPEPTTILLALLFGVGILFVRK